MHPSRTTGARPPDRAATGTRPHLLIAPSGPAAARAARDFVRAVLRGTPAEPLRDTAVLLTSEAVTRAHPLTDGAPDVLVRVVTGDGPAGVRVSVHGGSAPRAGHDGAADLSGLLFGALAHAWGTAEPGGTERPAGLWFELRAPRVGAQREADTGRSTRMDCNSPMAIQTANIDVPP
ncbi:ATP-binding protein [Streptomyces catenulae]|uniref:ATP-binding protein n=1 Tax=Streptomyces catenulae TaxID=66875 RepID=A0ABV2YY45_9ACTN|nr:ATP-binding protein [Streptomyces catenulae]